MKFTGKQITVMVVAVAAATVLAPAAVYATTGSSVNITDPVSASSKARVVGGKLEVGDGLGALTVDGLVKVTDGSGPLTVDGSVVPAEAPTAWSAFGDIVDNGTDQVVLKDIAANAGVSVGSITISHISGTGAIQVQLMARHPSVVGDCSSSGTVQAYYQRYTVLADDTRTITFAPRFRIPKQTSESCLFMYVTGSSGTQGASIIATGAMY